MQKRIITTDQPTSPSADGDWLRLDEIAEVELTSEDTAHPIEAALGPGVGDGWRAAGSGPQTIRLRFLRPQALRRIRLNFTETRLARTQEYLLRWSADGGESFREIVRQQWNFSPDGATSQTQDHRVQLPAVTVLELTVTPDTSGGPALASLAQLRLA